MRDDLPALRRCESCKRYTLDIVCPQCGARAVSPAPAKYSPEDKYARYRRQYKEEHAQQDA